MYLQTLLNQKNISKYRLSQISGVPKTTLIDICAGRSSIENCSAGTIYKLAKALDCSMEELMSLDNIGDYSTVTGLPNDTEYLEKGLPPYLNESLENMKTSWAKIDSGEKDLHWDLYWCELNADINSAEVDNTISYEQADYLREKYLRMKRN